MYTFHHWYSPKNISFGLISNTLNKHAQENVIRRKAVQIVHYVLATKRGVSEGCKWVSKLSWHSSCVKKQFKVNNQQLVFVNEANLQSRYQLIINAGQEWKFRVYSWSMFHLTLQHHRSHAVTVASRNFTVWPETSHDLMCTYIQQYSRWVLNRHEWRAEVIHDCDWIIDWNYNC